MHDLTCTTAVGNQSQPPTIGSEERVVCLLIFLVSQGGLAQARLVCQVNHALRRWQPSFSPGIPALVVVYSGKQHLK